MRRLLLLIALTAPLMAQADDVAYQRIAYQCDENAGRLSIAFLRAHDGDVSHREDRGWKLWNVDGLVSMKDVGHIGKLKTIKANCRLGKKRYASALEPAPQNMNVQGQCGAADLAAWVTVRRNGKPFLRRTELGPTCLGGPRFISAVVIDVHSSAPTLTTESEEP